MSRKEIVFVHSTFPDEESAEQIALDLLERNFAACVSVGSAVTSFYEWENQIQEEREIPVFIKTRNGQSESVQNYLKNQHPYDCPEILVNSVDDSDDEYRQWILSQTSKE